MPKPTVSDTSIVGGVVVGLERVLEALALHGPGDPELEERWESLTRSLYATWARLPYLVLDVGPEGLRWDAELLSPSTAEPGVLATLLAEAGVRSLTVIPGAELEEVKRFVTVLHQARALTPDDEDDLTTLLWKEDFERIHYSVEEGPAKDARAITEPGSGPAPPQAQVVREQVRKEAKAPRPPDGIVRLEKFDSTLYFLDRHEIEYLTEGIQREYAEDQSRNVVDLLLDTLEHHSEGAVRAETIEVLTELLPHLLGNGRFRTAAHMLREISRYTETAQDLLAGERKALIGLTLSLSQSAALAQLFHTLEDADLELSDESLGDLLEQLLPETLPTILLWPKRLTRHEARTALRAAVVRIVRAQPAALRHALASDDKSVVYRALRLVSRLKLESATEFVSELEADADSRVRAAVVGALASVGTAKAFRRLIRLIRDPAIDVRVAVLDALVRRPFASALAPVEQMIREPDLDERDLSEKRALFEAYGAMAGPGGVTLLAPLLAGKGGLRRRRASSDTRACAAVALGKIGTPAARAALERGARDRDPVVRNAAGKALRGVD